MLTAWCGMSDWINKHTPEMLIDTALSEAVQWLRR